MKKILIIAGGILLLAVVLFLVTGLIVPQDMTISRSTTISAPKDVVFRQMSCFKNWPNWSPWYKLEPTAQITYGGNDCGPGSSYKWKGSNKKTGAGEMKCNAINGSEMEFEVNFTAPREGNAHGTLKAEEENGATKATWSFRMHMAYPFNALAVIMNIDKMLGKDFEDGLYSLKKFTENPANH